MCLAITSDNHMDVRAKNLEKRVKIVRKTLTDVQDNFGNVDAYITVGDMTSRGLPENWANARRCFEGLKPAKQIFFTHTFAFATATTTHGIPMEKRRP